MNSRLKEWGCWPGHGLVDYWNPSDQDCGGKYEGLFDRAVRERFSEKGALCQAFDAGCLMLAFPDDSQLIHNLWELQDPLRQINDPLVETGAQLELKTYLKLSERMDPADKRRRHFKAFAKEGYFKPEKLRARDEAALESAARAFKEKLDAGTDGDRARDEFVREALQHARGFGALPRVLGSLLASTRHEKAIGEAYARLLLLSLDAMLDGADHRLHTYPFADQVVSRDQMLDLDRLHHELSALGRWPAFRVLTPRAREAAGGLYVQKTTRGIWKVKAAYSSASNEVWIDPSLSFHENAYTLYHELVHVADFHSRARRSRLAPILAELARPVSPEGDLELSKELARLVSEQELGAIDQQIRLYHALGPYTENWGWLAAESTRAWHDSYLGSKSYARLITREARQGPMWDDSMRWSLFAGVFYYGIKDTIQSFKSMPDLARAWRIDEAFWRRMRDRHRAHFDEIYLGGSLESSLAASVGVATGDYEIPVLPSLTCEQIARIRSVLRSRGLLGIPFAFEAKDECPVEKDGQPGKEGSHPGKEGSHPGKEGSHPGKEGSHPTEDAFPSIHGPETPGE